VIAAVARRSWTRSVLVGVIGLFVLLRLQDRVEPAVVLMALALAAVLWARGRLVQPSFLLQVAGLVAFAALAISGFLLAPDVGRYVIAAGWFAHGLWDLAHLRADSGVARTGAERCAVVDVAIAVQLVVLPRWCRRFAATPATANGHAVRTWSFGLMSNGAPSGL
jgi:hypothetical protein